MSKLYDYIPHPRAAELRRQRPVKTAEVRGVAHENWLTRLNGKVGLKITDLVGTMWAAYLFVLLALVSLPAALLSGDPIVIVAWIAQTFLQLVLLPIIIVGQNIQAQSADARSEATYKDAQALLQETAALQQHLDKQDEQLLHLREELAKLTARTL